MQLFKRYIDFRVKTEVDLSGTNEYFFILEVQHKFMGIKYWWPTVIDNDLKFIIKETRRLKKENG